MENTKMKKKILIFGATGYVGRYMVQVSVSMGHQTYAYTRPINLAAVTNQLKLKTIQDFKAMGVTIVEVHVAFSVLFLE